MAQSNTTNLVYVFPDQLRYRSLGYAGDLLASTPNIDQFAAQSVNFTNAVASAPVCTAYRASLLTGKYTTSHGMVINELRINPHQRCLAHVLTEAGYHTGYIGKWQLYANELGNHLDPRNSFVPRGPHRLGFDGEWMAYNFHHENYNTYYHTESPDKIFYGPGVYEPDAQTDLAIDFIERAAHHDRPFALFLSWGPPHDPWIPENVPPRFWELFQDIAFPNPPNYRPFNDEPYCDDWARLRDRDRAQLEQWRRGYYAQVASIDWNVGRLLAAIDATGQADHTIVVTFETILHAFLDARGSLFEKGLVFRVYHPLKRLGEDMRGTPTHEEYRVFCWQGLIVAAPDVPGTVDVLHKREQWETLAARIDNPFITMDVARQVDDSWIVVEVGDGGVSGLPLSIAPVTFYAALWKAIYSSFPRAS